MNKYIVKPIVEMNPIDSSIRWGVYDNSNIDPDSRHCINSDPNLNLILWTYNEETAKNICLLLMIDDFTWENKIFK